MLEALAKYNIKQVDVAREAGINHFTLSLWLQGSVKGNYINIEGDLAEWLDCLYSGRPRYTIHLELELDGKKYKEMFFWNIN